MLKNIFVHFKRITYKITNILIIIALISCLCICFGVEDFEIESKAASTQYTEEYNSKTFDSDAYPGYATLIDALLEEHPNWTFTIFYTGLDWSQVLKNETTVSHGRNLVSSSKSGDWICSVCGDTAYDNGSWRCASESAVAYYMDPRNSLYEDYIFQFENLEWEDGMYSVSGVSTILEGTFMERK